MSQPLSQHEAAAKALELELLSSHTRSDYELIEREGKMLASHLAPTLTVLISTHSNRFAGEAHDGHWRA